MEKSEVLARLRAHEPVLRAMRIEHLAIFGSTARGEQRACSDIDIAVTFPPGTLLDMGGFGYVDVVEAIGSILEAPIDVVTEPSRNPRMQAEIDRDRIDVF